jgi:hypothetical protein
VGKALGGGLAVLAAAVAVLGPLSFALLHAVYVSFYEPFGLAPEDVGRDSSRILATSIAAFIFGLFAWGFWWLCVYGAAAVSIAFIAPTNPPYGPRRGEALAGSIAGGALLAFIGGGGAQAISSADVLSAGDKRQAWLVVLLVPLAVLIGTLPQEWARPVRRLLAAPVAKWIACVGAVVLAAGAAAGALAEDASTIGRDLAAQVQDGHRIPKATLRLPAGTTKLRALDIQADVAEVEWLGRRPTAIQPSDCMMYLGSSGGIALLWNVSSQPRALYRIPESTIVIRTSDVSDCSKRTP